MERLLRLIDWLVGAVLWLIGAVLALVCIVVGYWWLTFGNAEDDMFIANSVSTSLPAPPSVTPITQLLPETVTFVCNVGPYASREQYSDFDTFLSDTPDLDIFPTSEHEGYFIYLDDTRNFIAMDHIQPRLNGYELGYVGDRSVRSCEETRAVELVIFVQNERRMVGLRTMS